VLQAFQSFQPARWNADILGWSSHAWRFIMNRLEQQTAPLVMSLMQWAALGSVRCRAK